MRVVILHQYTKFEVRRPCRSEDMAHDVSALMGLVTLIFNLLIWKLVCESHQRWGTFLPSLGTLCHWVLELCAIYATDGRPNRQTEERTDGLKQRLLPLPYGGDHNNKRPLQVDRKHRADSLQQQNSTCLTRSCSPSCNTVQTANCKLRSALPAPIA